MNKPKTVKKRSQVKDEVSRAWFFTINAHAGEDGVPTVSPSTIKAFFMSFPGDSDFVYQLESGEETGYVHYQGTVLLDANKARRFSDMKKAAKEAGIPDAHIEKTRKVGAAARYCGKSETRLAGPWWSSDAFREKAFRGKGGQGARSDRQAIRDAIDDGLSPAEILLDSDLGLAMNADCRAYAESYWTELNAKKWAEEIRDGLQVFYIYGPTGCGKTTFVRSAYPSSKDLFSVRLHTRDPWGNYSFQSTLLIDEFRESAPLEDMLLYLDRFPVELDRRYHDSWAAWKTVFVVSNWPFERQYAGTDKESLAAWKRRFTRIIDFSESAQRDSLANLVKVA